MWLGEGEEGLGFYIGCFSRSCSKTHDNSHSMQEGLILSHSLRIRFILEGKSWWQERGEATPYLLSRSRER